jgi:glutathione S-transferase
MKLHGSFTSPYVRHCRIALMESGLNWSFVETDHDNSARLSPSKKIPFLTDGDMLLSDSSSILMYIREKAGQPFISDALDFDLFCLINTLLDAAINRFYLAKDGITE